MSNDIEHIRHVGRATASDVELYEQILDKKDLNNNGIPDHMESLQKAPALAELIKTERKNVFRRVGIAIKATLAGETTVGVIGGELKNALKHFIPGGEKIDQVTDAVGDSLKTEKPMIKKITSIKNFINVRDESGNFSWQEVAASVIQIAIVSALVYGLDYLGIFEKVIQVLESL